MEIKVCKDNSAVTFIDENAIIKAINDLMPTIETELKEDILLFHH